MPKGLFKLSVFCLIWRFIIIHLPRNEIFWKITHLIIKIILQGYSKKSMFAINNEYLNLYGLHHFLLKLIIWFIAYFFDNKYLYMANVILLLFKRHILNFVEASKLFKKAIYIDFLYIKCSRNTFSVSIAEKCWMQYYRRNVWKCFIINAWWTLYISSL